MSTYNHITLDNETAGLALNAGMKVKQEKLTDTKD
jgi:hypothetical protein